MSESLLELETDKMSYGPAVVGRVEVKDATRHGGGSRGDGGKTESKVVVFVRGAAPGERVLARVTRRHKNYWEAELVKVLRPSQVRAEPPCPVFGRCGGCQWQHLTYEAQVEAKADILIHQLQRATRIDADELRSKLVVHPAAHPLGYRARIQAHGDSKGLGFFAPGSHKIVYTDHCPISHSDIQNAWREFEQTRPLAELAKASGSFKVEWSRTESGQVREAINRKHAAFGFTQVNPEQNAVLVDVVSKLAAQSQGELLLDLYGGTGNLSRRLTDRYSHVVCVDSENDGVDPIDMKARPLEKFVLVRDDVDAFLRDQRWRDWGFEKVDCVIADPPRNGMREASSLIRDLNTPRIVFVSCDPSTLARDLVPFVQPGLQSRAGVGGLYVFDSIHLVDMFPQTYHLEAVVCLRMSH